MLLFYEIMYRILLDFSIGVMVNNRKSKDSNVILILEFYFLIINMIFRVEDLRVYENIFWLKIIVNF